MSLHVVQALVEVGEHFGKLFGTHKVGSTGSIQPAGHGLEVSIVLEVVVHVIGQDGDAALFSHQRLALGLKGGRLLVDSSEGFGQ